MARPRPVPLSLYGLGVRRPEKLFENLAPGRLGNPDARVRDGQPSLFPRRVRGALLPLPLVYLAALLSRLFRPYPARCDRPKSQRSSAGPKSASSKTLASACKARSGRRPPDRPGKGHPLPARRVEHVSLSGGQAARSSTSFWRKLMRCRPGPRDPIAACRGPLRNPSGALPEWTRRR